MTSPDRSLLLPPGRQEPQGDSPGDPYPDAHRHAHDDAVPQVEVLARPPGPAMVREPLRRARRFRVFALVFLLILAAGSLWNFTRPPLYRAAATLLVQLPDGVGYAAGAGGADPQNLAVQSRILLGQELLTDTLARAAAVDPGIDDLDPEALRRTLDVRSTEGTNLLELSATGGDPGRLAVIVQAWTEAYLDRRRTQSETDVRTAEARFQDEYDRLAAEKRAKAAALDRYRAEHDIDSMEQEGNQAPARLAALTKELNTARADEQKAEAAREALDAAIARGEPVVPPEQESVVRQLVSEAAKLRSELAALEKRYTRVYLDSEPTLKELPGNLARLDAQIKQEVAKGQAHLRSTLTRDLDRARRQARLLEQQLAVQRSEASRFTSRFAHYQTLKQDLERVDELHRTVEQRLIEVRTKAQDRYPQVKVLEPAVVPRRPFQPEYWRDFLYNLGAALLAALAAVLLLEFLSRRERTEDERLPVTGVRVFAAAPGSPAGLTADRGAIPLPPRDAVGALEAREVPSLPGVLPRELLAAEVRALTELADPATRQAIGLLLSGLTPGEVAALDEDAIDLAAAEVRVPGDGRRVPLAGPLRELFAGYQPVPLWSGAPGLDGVAGLLGRIRLLAHDAGLAHPTEVDAAALRHTYICHLVRQGARLTEIERIIGRIPAAELARYGVYSPAGAAKPLAAIQLDYPVL